MYRIDIRRLCLAWFVLLICAAAEESPQSEIDRYKNPEAWMNSPSRRRPDPGRPMCPELRSVNPIDLENLKSEDLAKMSLNDPLLKYAYVEVFTQSMDHLRQMSPQQKLALADMRQRGESVSPVLLKLIEENKETVVESLILWGIEDLGTVSIDPYLEYARKLLRERTQSKVVTYASALLARQGLKEDVELLEWLLEQDPFMVTDVSKYLKVLRERLNTPQPGTHPERRPSVPAVVKTTTGATKGETEHNPHSEGFTISRIRSWVIGGLISILFGTYYLRYRGLRRPRS